MPHIDEDGRCSWCGWAPDDAFLEHLAYYLCGDYDRAWAEEWELHFRKHRQGLLPRPQEMSAEQVLAEAQTILWLGDAREGCR